MDLEKRPGEGAVKIREIDREYGFGVDRVGELGIRNGSALLYSDFTGILVRKNEMTGREAVLPVKFRL